jgi:hypothetical protein
MRAYRRIPALLIVAAGCSGGAGPAVESRYDSEQAKAALVTALDAWKKGEARSLSRRNPPIRFVDDDLAAGLQLSDYEIEEPDAPVSLHKNIPVILSLRDARGRAVRRETQYQVATEPGLAVLRSDP